MKHILFTFWINKIFFNSTQNPGKLFKPNFPIIFKKSYAFSQNLLILNAIKLKCDFFWVGGSFFFGVNVAGNWGNKAFLEMPTATLIVLLVRSDEFQNRMKSIQNSSLKKVEFVVKFEVLWFQIWPKLIKFDQNW